MDHRESKRIPENIYFCFIYYTKAVVYVMHVVYVDCMNYNKLWKILKEVEIPDHLIYLLRNLYAGKEETVSTVHGTMNWFKIGKGVKAVYCHPA